MAQFMYEGRGLHYLERGRGEAVVLIHGLGSSGADWALQVRVLEKHFRVIVPDLPGSGHSAPMKQYSIDRFARALWGLIDSLQLERVNLVGFSLGGAVGLEMALQRPEAVSRLALINSLASYRLDHWTKWLEACLPMVLIPLLGMSWVARLGARRLFPQPWQTALRARAATVVGAVPAACYLGTGRSLIGWSALERLGRLKARTLMIAAENDLTPLAEKQLHAARLGADLIVVRGSRHGTPFDAVRVTNASLLALLTDSPLPPADRWLCDRTAHPLAFNGSLAEEHARAGATRRRIDSLHPAF
ncbi:MAG TPA: alpha/beta hydrolase [Steroidobacteraceae bacterium]|nr:alpha/beta hydrolase [Steroidobacteraceae bacterium]